MATDPETRTESNPARLNRGNEHERREIAECSTKIAIETIVQEFYDGGEGNSATKKLEDRFPSENPPSSSAVYFSSVKLCIVLIRDDQKLPLLHYRHYNMPRKKKRDRDR